MLGFHPLSRRPLSSLPTSKSNVGVVTSPQLVALPGDSQVTLKWSIGVNVVVTRFELRRSTEAFPVAVGDGELIYSGTEKTFVDNDVVNFTRYFYTIFAVRFETPLTYIPYDAVASDTAVPRPIVVARVKLKEYVPVRGEFGKTSRLTRLGKTTSVWGEITGVGPRLSDMISAPAGDVVLAPVTGIVSDIVDSDQGAGLKNVAIDSIKGGFRFTIKNVSILPLAVVGARLIAGTTFARAGSALIEFSITKLATTTIPERTVRPLNYYLTAEVKNAR